MLIADNLNGPGLRQNQGIREGQENWNIICKNQRRSEKIQ